MTDTKYDIITSVEIGYDTSNKATVTNVVSFDDRLVSPDGDHVRPLNTINSVNPGGVHQNQKYWEMTLVLDSDDYAAFYTEDVTSAGVGVAIDEDGENDAITWFKVNRTKSDGTTDVVTFTAQVFVTGEVHDYRNDENAGHNPSTYTFICTGNRTVA